eukprot:m.8764 g.8764  ORF g.8764 m.8764 type:complete len:182 (+) comp6732_c0_seq1:434-979(+)
MVLDAPDGTAWSELVPIAQRTYNNKANRNIGVAPAQMVYGGAVDLDRQLLLEAPPDGDQQTYDAHVQGLIPAQAQIVEASAAFQEAVAKALKDAPPTPTVLNVGDLVLVQPATRKHRGKLQPCWLGPYTIIDRDSNTYQCQDSNTGNVKHVHIRQPAQSLSGGPALRLSGCGAVGLRSRAR